MAITNAGRLGQNPTLGRLIQNGPWNLQFMEVLPWYGVEGKQLEVVTTPQFPAPTAVPQLPGAALVETPRNPSAPKVFPIVDFMTRYDINFADLDTVEFPNSLIAEYDAASMYSLIGGIASGLDTGHLSPAFPALHTLTDQITLVTGLPTLEDFNRTLLRVATNDGYDVVVMGNLDALNTYWHACNERGINPNFWMRDVPSAMGGTIQRPTAWVQHARWYVNELIPTRIIEEPEPRTVSNIYFMQLGYNPDFGTSKGVFGIIPKPRIGNMMVRRELQGQVPSTPTTITTTTSVIWSFPAGIAVGSNRSLAVMQDVEVLPVVSVGGS
jgi:hypothetical protein